MCNQCCDKQNLIQFIILPQWGVVILDLAITIQHLICKSKHGVCLCGKKLGRAWKILPIIAPSLWSKHGGVCLSVVTNRAGRGGARQGRAARAAVAGGWAKCHFY